MDSLYLTAFRYSCAKNRVKMYGWNVPCSSSLVDGVNADSQNVEGTNRVWFYGLYGTNQDKVAVLKHQLHEMNEQTA